VDAVIESGTTLTVDTHVHDTSDFVPKLVESSGSSQIFRYLFVTHLIEDEIDHDTIYSSVVTSSGPSESPRVDYDFMVIPSELSSSESSEFCAIIQQVISSVSSFTGCLEFVSESSITPLAGLDVCPPRHPRYIIFSSLRVMLECLLHCICLTHIDDITKPIAIYNENYKFDAYPYSILQEFTVDNKVIITSHREEVARFTCIFR